MLGHLVLDVEVHNLHSSHEVENLIFMATTRGLQYAGQK